MKHYITLTSFLLATPLLHAQVQSSCNIPPALQANYARDIAGLVMTDMYATNSPDTQYVHIPPNRTAHIGGGLAAIYNTIGLIPQADSVFDRYCVHDVTSPLQSYSGTLVEIDTTQAWTQSWRNLVSLTGNPAVDDMVTRYSLRVTQYFNWSFAQYVLVETDSLWNQQALIDSLMTIPGIPFAEPNQLIGGAGRITYNEIPGYRYYNFYFEYSDCFDGCDAYRRWTFRVDPSCTVEYLGFQDWGVFGIQPLPDPIDCNISTALPEQQPLSFQAIPNPSTGRLSLQFPQQAEQDVQVEVLDLMGRSLLRQTLPRHGGTLDLSHLSPAMYLVRATQGEGSTGVQKVLIRR